MSRPTRVVAADATMLLTPRTWPWSRALSPATLASLWSPLSGPPAEIEAQPHAAVRLAQELAGEDGAVVATGSIYLVADLLAAPGTRRRSVL